MRYEILYIEDKPRPWVVIQREWSEKIYFPHSEHASEEIAELVKEALEARERNDEA